MQPLPSVMVRDANAKGLNGIGFDMELKGKSAI